MILGCIYAHRNKINGKYYIGQTIKENPEKRWQNGTGYTNKQSKFYKAIQKYGWENFEHIILESNVPITKIDEREAYWIKYYDSVNNGYNILWGGNHHTYSEEMRQHIREGWTEEIRLRQSKRYTGAGNPMYGVHRTGKESSRKVGLVCITTGEIFPTIKQAMEWCHGSKQIFRVLKKDKKIYGKHPQTNEPLEWRYATEEEMENI